ncbi:MAG: response regulator transcription factor [Opitutales bacterium]|nr:response regulator transcription factor [Opitutales bacterium]
MNSPHILVVEDDEDISRLICFHLEREGYDVRSVGSGEKALDSIYQSPPEMILLDLMLPALGGLQLCKILKNNPKTETIPIVMVTAKGEENDVVKGLELGADDYMVKPFRPRELVARIQAIRRRSSRNGQTDARDVITVENLEIHKGKREVLVGGELISLTYTEFEILYILANKPGWVFSRYQIVNAIRGEDYPVTDRSIDVQIVSLRRKLQDAGQLIETVRGIGYRFKDTTL